MSEAIAPNPVVTAAIDSLCEGVDLDSSTSGEVLAEVMGGRVNESQTAGFLIALRAKGETASEVAGLASTMRSLATRVEPSSSPLVDTAGTGGGASTFNVSTTAALIAAGAGVHMAKHGNRSATSQSGSADVLEALGVRIDLGPDQIAKAIDEIGFGFMFAPGHHSATRFVVPVRMGLGTRTVFNILGPLTNPAGATRQVVGVGDPTKVEVMAEALAQLGTEKALVIHSEDGLDEISIAAPTRLRQVVDGTLSELTVSPSDFGVSEASLESVRGGTPDENAATTRAVLAGQQGAPRDLSVMNAAAAIYVGTESEDLLECADRARTAIDDGSALKVLQELQGFGG